MAVHGLEVAISVSSPDVDNLTALHDVPSTSQLYWERISIEPPHSPTVRLFFNLFFFHDFLVLNVSLMVFICSSFVTSVFASDYQSEGNYASTKPVGRNSTSSPHASQQSSSVCGRDREIA